MPVYEYECKKCGEKFEVRRGFFDKEKGKTQCPAVHFARYGESFFVVQLDGIGQRFMRSIAKAFWLRIAEGAVGPNATWSKCEFRTIRRAVTDRPFCCLVQQ